MLCDADKRLVSPILNEATRFITIRDFILDYIGYQWGEAYKEAVANIMNAITPGLEKIAKQLKEFLENFKDIITKPKWYRFNMDNNYRKIHRMPMIRKLRQRCRWRQRESHRKLAELSPDSDSTEGVSGIEIE
ncbi:hypothetical protein DEAC_c14050 [Desulfosporosinus acididurans]|uniref:Uncharacterized protein n=1 Tax=Desulfosporosinus acididurans TaxID=476652 RepID=A0A0J1FTW7_9FIRM|nr:hypothetical protein [Desulfosporosinus acididurans]KLU66737.1 hypothetical protein DEAC_c14050 [Desulfosporosinus acididurans]